MSTIQKKPTKLPPWFKVKMPNGSNFKKLQNLVKNSSLHTVCEEAHCPNIGSCWEKGTATFMILGEICTRACAYCAVTSGKPNSVDRLEPFRLANAVKQLNLKYAVITSVNRDDLPDGGSSIFAECVIQVKKKMPDCKIEVLIPDFCGDLNAIDTVLAANPDTINHNIETVERLFHRVRPKGNYFQSIDLLGYVKTKNKNKITKSGMMVGLGETQLEIIQTMKALRSVDCDILTIGQYLQPSKKHIKLSKWYKPEEFKELENIALSLGFKHAFSGPLVRSSYHAGEQYESAISQIQ